MSNRVTCQVDLFGEKLPDNRKPDYRNLAQDMFLEEVAELPEIADNPGKRYTIRDIKKGSVRVVGDAPLFTWLSNKDAQEVSNALNKKGYDTVIVNGAGGIGISNICDVYHVEKK